MEVARLLGMLLTATTSGKGPLLSAITIYSPIMVKIRKDLIELCLHLLYLIFIIIYLFIFIFIFLLLLALLELLLVLLL